MKTRAEQSRSDQALIELLVACDDLTDREVEAFASMAQLFIDKNFERVEAVLTNKQREWAKAVALAHDLIDEEAQNLYSAGLVPDGIKKPKTNGEQFAAEVLSNRPLTPPGRRSA